MATFQHPASLNILQQFGQACSILRHTTRASNPAWYQEALELNLQLHIRADGQRMSCHWFDRRQNAWSTGPAISEETGGDPAKLDPVIAGILKHAQSSGVTGLGVILHIADEFATAELKPELDNPAALPDLRETACNDPAAILEDSSITPEHASWRVIPYPAAGSEVIGTAICLSRQYDPLLRALREAGESANFPIITRAVSAPLVAVMGLPEAVAHTPGKPFVAVLQYPWFTTLAFFNEHSDLRLIRTLQHRGTPRASQLRNALATTSASLEFVDPDLFIVPLGPEVDDTLEANLRVAFTTSRVELVHYPEVANLPSWCPELAVATHIPAAAAESAAVSITFTMLRDEKWALQDFLPTSREIVEIFPSRAEMRLLRVLRLARVAVVAVTILCLAYFTFGVIDLVRRPEWAFDPSQAEVIKSRLGMLNSERQKADHWNNLLEDRSKAWAAMEALARMFADNSGMLVKGYSHSVKPEATPGQSKVGFTKEWKITGYARDDALEYLNTLNTREGINAHFSEVARVTGNQAYDPTVGNRNITVNVRTQENNSFKPAPLDEASMADESTYPFTFDLTITQRFEATDPMALTVPKVP